MLAVLLFLRMMMVVILVMAVIVLISHLLTHAISVMFRTRPLPRSPVVLLHRCVEQFLVT